MYRRLLHGRRVEWGVWAKITWLRRPNGWQKFTMCDMPLGSRVRSPGGGVRSAFLFIFKRHNIRPSLRLGARSERASSRSPHPTPLSTQEPVRKRPPSTLPSTPLPPLFALPRSGVSGSSPPKKERQPSSLLAHGFPIPPRGLVAHRPSLDYGAVDGNAGWVAGGPSVSGHGSTSIITLRRSGGSECRFDFGIYGQGVAGGLRQTIFTGMPRNSGSSRSPVSSPSIAWPFDWSRIMQKNLHPAK